MRHTWVALRPLPPCPRHMCLCVRSHRSCAAAAWRSHHSWSTCSIHLRSASFRVLGGGSRPACAWFAAPVGPCRAAGRVRFPNPRSPPRSPHVVPPSPGDSSPFSLRHPLVGSPSSWCLRALFLLHPYLLPPPSPRVGWCGVLDLDSWLGPFPCRAGKFSVIPVHSFLHQHPRKGVERPHASFSLGHFYSPLGAPTGSFFTPLYIIQSHAMLDVK